jgi:hypothetical protein
VQAKPQQQQSMLLIALKLSFVSSTWMRKLFQQQTFLFLELEFILVGYLQGKIYL